MPNDVVSTVRSLLKSKEYQLCIDVSTVALSTHPDLKIFCNRGIAYAKIVEYVLAIQDFTTILDKVKRNFAIHAMPYYAMIRMHQT